MMLALLVEPQACAYLWVQVHRLAGRIVRVRSICSIVALPQGHPVLRRVVLMKSIKNLLHGEPMTAATSLDVGMLGISRL